MDSSLREPATTYQNTTDYRFGLRSSGSRFRFLFLVDVSAAIKVASPITNRLMAIPHTLAMGFERFKDLLAEVALLNKVVKHYDGVVAGHRLTMIR